MQLYYDGMQGPTLEGWNRRWVVSGEKERGKGGKMRESLRDKNEGGRECVFVSDRKREEREE